MSSRTFCEGATTETSHSTLTASWVASSDTRSIVLATAVLREGEAALGALAQALEEQQDSLGVGEDVHEADLHSLGESSLHDVQELVERAGAEPCGAHVGEELEET
jgi:hypothetical protein